MTELPTDRVREVESLVTEWLHDNDVPGASLVVVDADGERYAEGFGARDLESNAPATPDTLYGIGSITKPMTALAVLQLAEAGHLAVEDPVDDYVDHYAAAPGDPVTIADLLGHTSGMPAAGPVSGLFGQLFEGVPAGVADDADFERWVRASTAERVTGEDRFAYYNTGYTVLGTLVEAVDGRTYADYVREEILDPLGMERSTFDPDAFEADDDAMTGYAPGEDGPEPTPFPFEEFLHPPGGLLSSARELSRFLRATMTDGSLDGSRVCTPETLERCQRPRSVFTTFLDGAEREYGFGWHREPLGDDAVVGHGGGILVSSAYAGFLDDGDLGVAVTCNTSASPSPHDVGKAVLAVLTGRDPTAVPAFALEAKCEAVTGTYETFRGTETATVEREDGGLAVEIAHQSGEERVTAFPDSLDPDDHTFHTITGDGARMPVEFDLSGDRADLFVERNRFRRVRPGE